MWSTIQSSTIRLWRALWGSVVCFCKMVSRPTLPGAQINMNGSRLLKQDGIPPHIAKSIDKWLKLKLKGWNNWMMESCLLCLWIWSEKQPPCFFSVLCVSLCYSKCEGFGETGGHSFGMSIPEIWQKTFYWPQGGLGVPRGIMRHSSLDCGQQHWYLTMGFMKVIAGLVKEKWGRKRVSVCNLDKGYQVTKGRWKW